MPSSVLTGAVYGVGVYDTSIYGSYGVTVSVDGVSATATLNDTLQISADASHTICTLCLGVLPTAVGAVDVVGNATTAVTGISATATLGTPIIVATTVVPVTGVSVNGSTNTVDVFGEAVVPVSMPVALVHEIVFGITVPDILADANIVAGSVFATGQVQQPSVAASSNALVTGVNTTSNVGTVSLETNNYLDISGIEIVSNVGSPVIIAKATVTITGVFATGSIGSVTILENEVQIPPAVVASFVVGTVTINTTAFDFNAVASQYSRTRTAYIPRKPTAKERTVIIPAGQ